MRGRAVINAVLVLAVIGGGVVMAEGIVHYGSRTSSSAAAAAQKLSPVPAPSSSLPTSSTSRAPAYIPQAMPETLAVQTSSGTLIRPTPVDQTRLVMQNGAVKPGNQPGLYIADKVSTLPGTDQGTVIIGGHAKAGNDKVFNPLMQLGRGDLNNSQVTLQMPQGQLTYTIEALYLVDKVDLPTQHALADDRPGRLELITCDVEGGQDTFQNLIVVACDASHRGCSTV